ncbi:tripartite tricarboxylate transporter substrate binding protein [Roseomonas sp. 18066]|uniref:Bug family tripartite tricarboxylate transporter substrate binding protein n=1 Tax=Roseomonas sp. 18066 TaxID=2681412 RepID=UPI00135BB1F5|nr:tripartite tricarboxylate transporter substrate binding protein [Roseomonas sp. 18066]
MTELTRRGLGAGMAAGLFGAAGAARAQAAWPTRPVRFVIPWPPGGLNDVIARGFNDQVSQALGQVIVNDFKAGAGGRIGVAEIARSAPDGYTIGMGNLGPLTIFPHLYKNMPYDAARDLVPVTMFAASPLVLVATKDLPASNVAELIALARARPGKLNFASVGVGTAQHLIFEMFRARDGIAMEHVPYKGTNESLPAMLGGDVHAMFDTLPLMLGPIRNGMVKPLAVTTPARIPQLPDVPTLAEAGYPEIDVVTWYAVIAPAGTPQPIVDRLYRAYTEAAALPAVKKLLEDQGLIYLPNAPGEFATRIRAESARWAGIIERQGIRVE